MLSGEGHRSRHNASNAGWAIHSSQENYTQESYYLPTWLIYSLWDNEFYSVRDLEKEPLVP